MPGLFVKTLKAMGMKDPVVVSPDVGSNKMARKFAEDLNVRSRDCRQTADQCSESRSECPDRRCEGQAGDSCRRYLFDGKNVGSRSESMQKRGRESVFAVVSHALLMGEAAFSGDR